MGSVIAKVAFAPPDPTYSRSSNITFITTSLGDQVPYLFHDTGAPLTIVFSHANAEDIGMVNIWMQHVANTLGVNTCAYEFPGYGLASGEPSEAGTLAAAEACVRHLSQTRHIPPERVVVWGRSICSGPSVHLAATFPVRGLILQSAFTSILRVPMAINQQVEAPFDMFGNIHTIGKVHCPVFVIHGMMDEICPVAHGIQLYEACSNPWQIWTIPLATHDNIELEHLAELLSYVRTFLAHVESSYAPPSGKFMRGMDALLTAKDGPTQPRSAK